MSWCPARLLFDVEHDAFYEDPINRELGDAVRRGLERAKKDSDLIRGNR